MLTLTPTAAALIALVCGGWLAVAVWATLRALRRSREAVGQVGAVTRSDALLAASPAIALFVGQDGSLHGSERAAFTLGLTELPDDVSAPMGLAEEDASALRRAIADAQASGAGFVLTARPEGGARVLELRGGPAPPALGDGILVWLLDVTDIASERSAAEARAGRLATALDALSGLIEAAPFPMWHRGPDLRLAMVNSAYVEAVEAEDAAAVVAGGIELVDEPGEVAADHAAAARDSGASHVRTVPATIAGERRTLQVVEVPLGPAGVAGYALDVEDREQARAELARFVRAQRDMLDRLSAGVAQFGRDRALIFFNQPFARTFGLRADFLADRPEFNRLLDAMRDMGCLPEVRDYPDWKKEHGRWFTGGLAAEEEEWNLPKGQHLRVVAQPLPDGGLLLIFEDRTEQLRLASARDTLLRVRTATFDNLFEAIGVFASDGRLHLWNNRFRALWGFEEEQLGEHPRIDSLAPIIARSLKNPQHAGLVRELVRSATIERKQRTGRVAFLDGREFEFAAVPLPDGNALFTMLDVTASRTVEAALRERTATLEEADRMKTAFVSNMSYELRTPLTSIAGFAEMLEGGYAGALPAPATEYVGAILQSVARLGTLIDNVLDLTQSDSGSLVLADEEVDLAALCREAAEAFAPQAAAKGVDFAIELEKGLGSVTGDRQRLRQSLDNVLRNAVAYTDARGRILLHGMGTKREAAITVSDNGPGIAPADQARVFDRFHRTAEGGDSALGLGLPLARQFIEAHGGRVELQSEPEKGTTVTFRLPRKK